MEKQLNQVYVTGAYRHISFSPDKRAEQINKDWQDFCQDYKTKFDRLAETEDQKKLACELYTKFIDIAASLYNDYYRKLGNCASTMITGSSNFNFRLNNKRNESASKSWDKIDQLLPKLFKRYQKKIRPETGIIRSSDDNALEALKIKLAKLEELQETMKVINKICKSKINNEAKEIEIRSKYPKLSDDTIQEILYPRLSYYKQGFQSYALRNNLQNINTVKDRIAKVTLLKSCQNKEIVKDTCRIEVNYQDNRVRIFHESKPERSVIDKLKSQAFRWTPSLKCWQAYINDRSLRFINDLN